MSRLITDLIHQKVTKVITDCFPNLGDVPFNVEPARDKRHGDFATNAAFLLSRRLKQPALKVAEKIVPGLEKELTDIARVEVAGGGFINFLLYDPIVLSFLKEALQEKENYGNLDLGSGKRIQVEFVSVNPTGPLHVGHGKCAAFGDALSRLLKKAGFVVEKEYYINDAGRQIDLLGLSLEARLRQLLGEDAQLPEEGYQGEYLIDIARKFLEEKGKEVLSYPDEQRLQVLKEYAVRNVLDEIKQDLSRFRVEFDVWFSERELYEKKYVDRVLSLLKERGYTYEKDGALWLQTTRWGDDKDRVLIRENGLPTYFASDIAYHYHKFERKFDKVIDVWGADHHGYIPRMQAAMRALGLPEDFLEVFIVQFVTLLRGGQPERMSTRQGEFVPLRKLLDEVGVDVARYYFLMRDPATHLDFDIEEAKQQSMENPVYYIQYAHARICSLFREAEKKGFSVPEEKYEVLTFSNLEEREIGKKIAYFPELIRRSAVARQPYMICNYLHELAALFHSFYNSYRVVDRGDPGLTHSRLLLCRATQIVLQNGLDILGINAPQTM
ncbi:arginine--tRNA ligase [Thermatribacter velox]|jgi:arginyl-tRNA synthetase|uniref:Arginine--tRNA ligase n=1 Tax=Thermatribacter velox TaxID=3039681 RepID=A0ABZ2YFE8_9BACT